MQIRDRELWVTDLAKVAYVPGQTTPTKSNVPIHREQKVRVVFREYFMEMREREWETEEYEVLFLLRLQMKDGENWRGNDGRVLAFALLIFLCSISYLLHLFKNKSTVSDTSRKREGHGGNPAVSTFKLLAS